jgi:uncharacterized membrane protein
MVEGIDGVRVDPRQPDLFQEKSVRADPLASLEQKLGQLLVTGVIVSAVLLAAGLFFFLLNPGVAHSGWLLNGGLIVLIATPILRVIVSFTEYVRLRQWFFVAVTLVVLAELSITVMVALSRRH